MTSLIKGLDYKHMCELLRGKKNPPFSLINRTGFQSQIAFIKTCISNYMTIVIEIHVFLIPKEMCQELLPILHLFSIHSFTYHLQNSLPSKYHKGSNICII